MTQQWKLTLSYDGSHFHGWQVQPGLPTVQEVLARAVRDLTGESVSPQGSGRTDAGVHALAQVASFSLDCSIPADNFLRALNRILPSSIRVSAAERVASNFHARKSARAKTYEYRIFPRRLPASNGVGTREQICSPFLAPFVWDCHWPLDFEKMKQAAPLVCGTHDFTSFAASDPERGRRTEVDGTSINPVKTIWQSAWLIENDLFIYRVRGSGFLHHMVRNLVGTFVDIGRGAIAVDSVPSIMSSKNRSAAGPTAPPHGLFLENVEYDEPLTFRGASV